MAVAGVAGRAAPSPASASAAAACRPRRSGGWRPPGSSSPRIRCATGSSALTRSMSAVDELDQAVDRWRRPGFEWDDDGQGASPDSAKWTREHRNAMISGKCAGRGCDRHSTCESRTGRWETARCCRADGERGETAAGIVGQHRIAVLVPCYNEEAAIAKVVADFRAALPQADHLRLRQQFDRPHRRGRARGRRRGAARDAPGQGPRGAAHVHRRRCRHLRAGRRRRDLRCAERAGDDRAAGRRAARHGGGGRASIARRRPTGPATAPATGCSPASSRTCSASPSPTCCRATGCSRAAS